MVYLGEDSNLLEVYDMKKKLISVLAVLALVAFGISGCSAEQQPDAPTVEPPPAESNIPEVTPDVIPEAPPVESTSPEPTPEPEPEPVITVVDGITYVNGVLIVNKTYPYPLDHTQSGMTPETEAAYNQMIQDAAAEGLTLKMRTAYRSITQQTIIYNNYVNTHGQAAADRFSARPGHSEHHTGLAIDINSLETSFGETPEGIWLAEHCIEYGFILRYPKDSEEITGYMYEPWHVRYVGVELAQELYLGDGNFLPLETYLGITSCYSDASTDEPPQEQ